MWDPVVGTIDANTLDDLADAQNKKIGQRAEQFLQHKKLNDRLLFISITSTIIGWFLLVASTITADDAKSTQSDLLGWLGILLSVLILTISIAFILHYAKGASSLYNKNNLVLAEKLSWKSLVKEQPKRTTAFFAKFPYIYKISFDGRKANLKKGKRAQLTNQWWGELPQKRFGTRLGFWLGSIRWFDGITSDLCAFELEKPIRSTVIITPENLDFASLYRWKDVNLESPEFNKSFRIKTPGTVDTYLVLNPTAILALLELQKEVGYFSLTITSKIALLSAYGDVLFDKNSELWLKTDDEIEAMKQKIEKAITLTADFAYSVD